MSGRSLKSNNIKKPMNNFQTRYQKQVIPEMKKYLKIKNHLAVPKIEKVVINVGIGKEYLVNSKISEIVTRDLQKISGQKPLIILAKEAISGFKLKKNQPVGIKVTLRGKKMADFLEKLIHLALPRTKDFHGLKNKALDKNGNLNIGIFEQVAFPEIKHEEVEKIFSLEVTVVPNTQDRKIAQKLFKTLGFVFAKKED